MTSLALEWFDGHGIVKSAVVMENPTVNRHIRKSVCSCIILNMCDSLACERLVDKVGMLAFQYSMPMSRRLTLRCKLEICCNQERLEVMSIPKYLIELT